MPFTLTLEDVNAIFEGDAKGDHSAFLSRCTPQTTVNYGAALTPGEGGPGVYSAEDFIAKTGARMMTVIDVTTFKREHTAVDVVGNKAIAETVMTAKLINGGDYYNRFASFTEFDGETGKTTAMRVYFDTELGAKAEAAAKK